MQMFSYCSTVAPVLSEGRNSLRADILLDWPVRQPYPNLLHSGIKRRGVIKGKQCVANILQTFTGPYQQKTSKTRLGCRTMQMQLL